MLKKMKLMIQNLFLFFCHVLEKNNRTRECLLSLYLFRDFISISDIIRAAVQSRFKAFPWKLRTNIPITK